METDLEFDQRLTALAAEIQTLECPVCFGLCNEEIHMATLSIRGWLRDEMRRRTMEMPVIAEMPAVAQDAA